jgi:hypothetical protein
MIRAMVVWIAGLLTFVPYSVYFLFVHAERDQYAVLITFVLFWIFGYWGVVGPILAALKVRAVLGAIEGARTRERLAEVLQSGETREVAIDFIASEHRIPRFLARRVYRHLADRVAVATASRREAPEGDRPGAPNRSS